MVLALLYLVSLRTWTSCGEQGALNGAIRCGEPRGLELLTNVYLGVLSGWGTQIREVPYY